MPRSHSTWQSLDLGMRPGFQAEKRRWALHVLSNLTSPRWAQVCVWVVCWAWSQ